MKIIDNRYRIENIIQNNSCCESYKITDLWENDKKQYLNLYNKELDNNLINYLIDNFSYLSNIKHKYLLSIENFNLVKSIDARKSNNNLYYSIAEYIDGSRLNYIKNDLGLEDRLKIILDILLVIDFLHFRGFTYKYLNPSLIFVLKDKKTKISDLISVAEKRINDTIGDFERDFISPEAIIDKGQNHKRIDYYSIGVLIKYLFLTDYKTEDSKSFIYDDSLTLTNAQKNEFSIIINQLIRDNSSKESNLIEIINKISYVFDLNYKYDLIEMRETLFFDNKTIGREKEIEAIISIDNDIVNKNNFYNGLFVESRAGIGKSRLVKEIKNRLELKGRHVYSVKVIENGGNDLLEMTNILKQSMKDTPPELMDKYRDELSKLLPELRLDMNDIETDFSQKSEKFRMYNRITNYFTDLSKERIIYIIIDDLHNSNSNFIILLDYLIRNIKNKNIFFIFSFNEIKLNENILLKEKIKHWKNDMSIKGIELHSLDVEEIGLMLKSILGISYIPMKFSSVLFRESQGNPGYIEHIIKNLFSIGELYMDKKGKWVLKVDNYSDLYFPSDIDDAIKKQLDIIKTNYFEIFKVMSVFNDILYKKTLIKMVDMKEEDLEKDLIQLIKLKLVDEKVVDWGYSYGINNMKIKRLVYHEIEKKEKIELHKRAAEIISTYDYESTELEMEELLFHLIKSNQSNKAIDIIIKRVKSIENKYSPQSLYLWEKAYAVIKDNVCKTKLLVLNNLVDIYFLKGELEKSKLYLEEYQRDATLLQDYYHIIQGKVFLLDFYYRTSEVDLAFKEIENIEKISFENNCIEGKIIALSLRARLGLGKENLKESKMELEEAINLSEISGIKIHLGDIYNRLGLTYFLQGDIEYAIKNYKKSIIFHQENGDHIGAIKPINNIGNIYADNGNGKEAMVNYEKGLKIASKYGIQELEITFLSNIAEIYIENNEFDEALEYIQKARKMAVELQDIRMICFSYVNIGLIFVLTGDYEKAYESYIYLKELDVSNKIIDIEANAQYHKFLGVFYGWLGVWKNGIKHYETASKLYKQFNVKYYLESISGIVKFNVFETSYLDKEKINEIRYMYKETKFLKERRKELLDFALLAFTNNDKEYAEELLYEDSFLSMEYTDTFLSSFSNILRYLLDSTEKSLNKIIEFKRSLKNKELHDNELILNILIGLQAFNIGLFEESLKYLLNALDNIHRITTKIPNVSLKISYIYGKNGDLIKQRVTESIEKIFNKKLNYTLLKDIDKNKLYEYFDTSQIFDIMTNEDFVKIAQLNCYDDVIDIQDIDSLISKFTEDYKYNVSLTLSYMAKSSLASTGRIVYYDEKTDKYKTLFLVGNDVNRDINENIFILAGKTEKGILINNLDKTSCNKYSEFLTDDIKALICVPITIQEPLVKEDKRRKKELFNKKNILGYIYLEADKTYNKFDYDIFKMVKRISYLIFINMENSRLRLIATTDKITGLFTRQHHETKFEEFINNSKLNKEEFSILMMDIDKFKNINDTYGHRKGDEVLKLIGSTLKKSARSTDVLSRYGGEEFCVLLKNTTQAQAYKVAEKFRKNISNLKISGIEYPITVSIGISHFKNNNDHKEELIEKADQALYCAKENGRNKTVIWNNKMMNTSNRADKLAGILTGNTNEDNINILAIMDIIDLIKDGSCIDTKIFIFLGRILETLDAEYSNIILNHDKKDNKKVFSRARFNDEWVKSPYLNYDVIDRVAKGRKGEFLIDWDNIDNLDSLSGLPNWQSVIVIPMIRDEEVKGIIYISTSIQNKEFTFKEFNLSKSFGNIFAAII